MQGLASAAARVLGDSPAAGRGLLVGGDIAEPFPGAGSPGRGSAGEALRIHALIHWFGRTVFGYCH